MSPTQRSLKLLRERDYYPAVVEKWNSFTRTRSDLFGIVDVLAVRRAETLAVQCTSASNMSARLKKIADSEAIGWLRMAGWRIQVWGWVKRKNRWCVVERDIS